MTMKTMLLHFLCFMFLCLVASATDYNLKCVPTKTLAGFKSSPSSFFKSKPTPHCNPFNKNVCTRGSVQTFKAEESTLSAGCKDQNQIIESVTIGVDGSGNPTSLSVDCCTLAKGFALKDTCEKQGTETVHCGGRTALKKIALTYPNENQATTATVTCVNVSLKKS